jgi:predicted ester cyclase
VALLVFEAMGLTLGVGSRLSVPLPLDGAMAVLFIALAVFWGIVLFDLLRLTPFAYIWSALEDVKRSRLVRIVLACLVITGATGLAMGIWSQAQLKGGLTEPWQTVLPWFVRGCIVALLIAATAISGKPLGSALTGVMVAVLLVVRAGTFCALVALKLVLVVLRQIMKIPLTLVAFVAFLGHSMWNWVAGFGWARRLRIGRLTVAPLPVLGGDADSPLVFRGADGAAAAQGAVDLADSNKALMRRIYQGVYPSPDAHLEEFFALDVITRDIASNAIVKGVEAVQESLQQLRSAFRDLDLEVNDQVAEGDSVVSRLTLRGTLRAPFAGIATMGERVGISAIDFVRLMEGKVVERWGLLNPSSLSRVETVPPSNGKSDHVVPSA